MRFAKVHVFRERFIEGSGFNIGSPFMAHWIKSFYVELYLVSVCFGMSMCSVAYVCGIPVLCVIDHRCV